MKSFLVLTLVAFFAATVVAAVVFRSTRAKDTLVFIRNVGWAYVAAVIIIAAYRFYQMYS